MVEAVVRRRSVREGRIQILFLRKATAFAAAVVTAAVVAAAVEAERSLVGRC